MPVTGVYFIHSHPNSSTVLPTITERLRSTFPDEDLVPTGRWAMEHKLMRDTPGLLPPKANSPQTKPRYMQFLSLTHYPTRGFIYTSEPEEKVGQLHNVVVPPSNAVNSRVGAAVNTPQAVTPVSLSGVSANAQAAVDIPMQMTTLPMSSFGTMFQHFTYACQPFWCHRITFAVPAGIIYDVGDFRIRLGDVRQTFPTARVRGTVLEIEWRGPSIVDSLSAAGQSQDSAATGDLNDDDSGIELDFSVIDEADIDAEYTATAGLIHEFWSRIGIDGAREAILVPGIGTEVKARLKRYQAGKIGQGISGGPLLEEDPQAGADVARQYMEVLRFNR
ncbi:hypothetical protein N7495_004502 [Penicillium taxi]|uniref:uncharacterized protein n=1 Tax=Penicillium taxi TaxID=168475 RepID=UPI0025455F64|nr:uncharacterized protein N7495_004502 [Penicillium taxi]KAJ5899758.1 hypothetical protein N7495_004502 [Penicillium taxi]